MGVHLLPVLPASCLQISPHCSLNNTCIIPSFPGCLPSSRSTLLHNLLSWCPSQPPLEPRQLCHCTSLPPAGELLPQWTLYGPILVPTLMRCSCIQIQPLILILSFFFFLLIWKCLPGGHYRPGGPLWSSNNLVVPGSFEGWAWETWGVSIKGILGHIFVTRATFMLQHLNPAGPNTENSAGFYAKLSWLVAAPVISINHKSNSTISILANQNTANTIDFKHCLEIMHIWSLYFLLKTCNQSKIVLFTDIMK